MAQPDEIVLPDPSPGEATYIARLDELGCYLSVVQRTSEPSVLIGAVLPDGTTTITATGTSREEALRAVVAQIEAALGE